LSYKSITNTVILQRLHSMIPMQKVYRLFFLVTMSRIAYTLNV